MRYFLLLLIASFAFAGDPPAEKPLPPDVQKIVDAQVKAEGAAKAVYNETVAKATFAAAKQLDAVVKEKTKKGDLEGALAAKAILDKWNGDATALLGEIKPVVTVLAAKTLNWKGKYAVQLKPDGTAVNQWGEPWTWKMVSDNVVVTVVNAGGSKDYTFKPDTKGGYEAEIFGTIK